MLTRPGTVKMHGSSDTAAVVRLAPSTLGKGGGAGFASAVSATNVAIGLPCLRPGGCGCISADAAAADAAAVVRQVRLGLGKGCGAGFASAVAATNVVIGLPCLSPGGCRIIGTGSSPGGYGSSMGGGDEGNATGGSVAPRLGVDILFYYRGSAACPRSRVKTRFFTVQ